MFENIMQYRTKFSRPGARRQGCLHPCTYLSELVLLQIAKCVREWLLDLTVITSECVAAAAQKHLWLERVRYDLDVSGTPLLSTSLLTEKWE